MTEPRSEYEQRLARLATALGDGERRHLWISNARLLVFAAAAGVAWAAFIRPVLGPAWLLAPLLAFATLMVAHARVLNANDRLVRARRYYEQALAARREANYTLGVASVLTNLALLLLVMQLVRPHRLPR